ncbi:helix-turn-helix domain-containing protein [Rathayibacter sp. YIM 133350]|uniref:helix-turn-helix transcriptional regulator n=1 Tax=Rathayibacter sp. YIM 133350 TaxID=3131992 RepID=UPI00307EDACE
MAAERPALLTVADVAARFGVSTSTVRVWLAHHDAGKTGGVPGLLPDPLARGVVWLAEDIDAIAAQVQARSIKGGRPKRASIDAEPPAAGGEDAQA